MKRSSRSKLIRYLKARGGGIGPSQSRQGVPLSIPPNEEGMVEMQGIESNEQKEETLALLKMLALGTRQIEEGRVQPAQAVFQRIRDRSGMR